MARDLFVQRAAQQSGVPINLLTAMFTQESGFKKNARSNKGAQGIGQLMPATAKEMGVKNVNDPLENMVGSAKYLKKQLDTFNGNQELGLAAYNAGAGAVKKYGGVPPYKETQNYTKSILSMLNPISEAKADETPYQEPIDLFEKHGVKLEPQGSPTTDPIDLFEAHGLKVDAQSKPDLSWREVASKAVSNTPESALNFAKATGDVLLHPIDTAQGLLNTAQGGIQNLLPDSVNKAISGIVPGYDLKNKEQASAIGDFYKKRYGSEEGFKNAIASDPIGVAADISTLLGGAGALTKSSALSKASQLTNPANLAIKGVKTAANAVGKVSAPIIGVTTGAGVSALKAATEAGAKGGTVAADFLDNMRGNVPLDTVLDDAKGALSNMRSNRGANYRQGMTGVQADTKILPFGRIKQAVNDSFSVGVSRGGHVMNQSASGAQEKIAKLVKTWENGNPSIDHTAAGLDELKRAIGDVRDSSAFGTPERAVADKVYNAVKKEIIDQVPSYKGVMAEYEKQSTLIKEIERALSLGDKASADTSMRKLQSLTRNNVNTNFGNRTELAKQLEGFGADNLLTKVSGQALSSPTPRGLQALAASGLGGAALALQNPSVAGGLLLQSPRLMGEAAYYAGKTKGMANKVANNKLSQALIKSSPSVSVANRLSSKDKNK